MRQHAPVRASSVRPRPVSGQGLQSGPSSRLTHAGCAQFVFGTCAAGAVVLTVNVVLLGGNIGFFQSMCLLGYCLFPMDLAALVAAFTTNMIARWIVVLVSTVGLSLALAPALAAQPVSGASAAPRCCQPESQPLNR
jgi:hypothetical protein